MSSCCSDVNPYRFIWASCIMQKHLNKLHLVFGLSGNVFNKSALFGLGVWFYSEKQQKKAKIEVQFISFRIFCLSKNKNNILKYVKEIKITLGIKKIVLCTKALIINVPVLLHFVPSLFLPSFPIISLSLTLLLRDKMPQKYLRKWQLFQYFPLIPTDFFSPHKKYDSEWP